MDTFISSSPEQTLALGEQWGRQVQPGCVIGLSGDLGAGKTQLVKGIARGLGISEPVRSPTFALMHEYAGGRCPLVHLDFYRLDHPAQIQSAGLEEYLTAPPGLTVAEWIERWIGEDPSDPPRAFAAHCLGHRYRHVHIECLSEAGRRIAYEDFGA